MRNIIIIIAFLTIAYIENGGIMNKSTIAVPLAALLSTVIAAQSSVADDNTSSEIEEVIVIGELSRYGATKSATPILETARSISIEREEVFRDKGALTLDDTLNYSSGVVGDTFGYSTRGDFPKIRGFNAAEYRDGQQVLFGFYNNTRSDVYMLEQVEVLKGPASVLYGKGTPGGIVNAISKLAGPDIDNEVVIDVGSEKRRQLATDVNYALSDQLYLRVVGLYRDSDTQVDFIEDDAAIVMPSITYQSGATNVTVMAELVDRDSDTAHQFLPLEATGCVSDDITVSSASACANATGQKIEGSTYLGQPGFNRYDTESTLLSLLVSHELSDTVSIDATTRYKEAEADYRQAWIDFNRDGNPRVDSNGNAGRTFYFSDATSEQLAIDIRMRWEFTIGSAEHELFTGIAYQDVTTDNDSLFARSQDVINIYNIQYGATPLPFNGSTPLVDGPESNTEEHGLYLNDQISFGAWKVNVGIRYDDTKSVATGAQAQTDYALSASAGLLYSFDIGLSPYISYAESFEPVIGTDGFTNQALKPREGEQFEIGLKYLPRGASTYITVAYFDIEESNLPNPASLIGQPDSQQEGIGTATGLEMEVQTVLGDVAIEANLTLLDTETPNDVPFASIPEQQFSTWIQYQPSSGFLRDFKTGLGVRYVGENESNGFDVTRNEPVRVVTDGYTLIDAMLGYETQEWDITLVVRNLSDKEYYGTCLARGDCFPGEQRTAVARLAYKF